VLEKPDAKKCGNGNRHWFNQSFCGSAISNGTVIAKNIYTRSFSQFKHYSKGFIIFVSVFMFNRKGKEL